MEKIPQKQTAENIRAVKQYHSVFRSGAADNLRHLRNHESRESAQDYLEHLKTKEGEYKGAAQISKEYIFEEGQKIISREVGGWRLEIEKIDDQTLKITESKKIAGESVEGCVFVLPIFIIQQTIPEEQGNLGSINISEGWARGGNDSTLDSYKHNLPELLDSSTTFFVGTAQDFLDVNPPPENENSWSYPGLWSGARCSWQDEWQLDGNYGKYCKTEAEATKYTEVLAVEAGRLDNPSIPTSIGNITPRELFLLKKVNNLFNVLNSAWHQDVDRLSVDDWINSDSFYSNLVSCVRSLPQSPEVYASEPEGNLLEEADRLSVVVARSILERVNADKGVVGV